MFRPLIRHAALVLFGLAAIGCKSDAMSDSMEKDGMMTVVMAQDKDEMKAAPMDGTYMLYAAPSSRPMLTVTLKKGDMLGFKKMPDGKLMAMAGGQKADVTGMKNAMWQHGVQK